MRAPCVRFFLRAPVLRSALLCRGPVTCRDVAPPVGIAAALLSACALLSGCDEVHPKTALGYTEGAKHAYEMAMEQFNTRHWVEAEAAMREVKRKYSYSKYARLAELRIADADYEQEKYSDAIREYKDFVHAHRSDEEDVAYARARIGEAMYAEIPDSFLMASAEERDQGSVVDAYKELKSFVTDYPNAKEAAHVRDLLGQVTARLIRHELYVARFYSGKGNFDAAVARVQYALHNYPQETVSPHTSEAEDSLRAEALLLLGETYLKMHKWDDARQAFEAIVRVHGRTPIAVQARNYLTVLPARGG
ncbi:MAG TPA: outer membrane protein assembly factor BamD [Polyangiaceae bacterium]|nr:outer membrane protein assembly factor BamD [Polyangiaceae bacterium]